MPASTAPNRVITVEALDLAGFSAWEIERLTRLKRHYPYIEFTDNAQQWQRLAFLKWRLETGRVNSKGQPGGPSASS